MLDAIGIDRHTLHLLGIIALIGAAVVVAIYLAIRTSSQELDQLTTLPWYFWIGMIAVVAIITRATPESEYISAADKIIIQHQLQRPPQKVLVDLSDCPPAGPGMTDQILLFIKSRADDKPVVRGCTRIKERPYLLTKGETQ